ncbi:MAG: HD domain-containing protein [Lachnospiraceae bacterium]|nr:HD domain-containing protein [Lachnospiraceae bacterium]
MLFVKNDALKVGMRLARPIYNKNGVLLYERNSKLTQQGIDSIKNFGLIGIFILEPAEPVPPMTADDIEFERFQTMQVFAIEEELKKIAEKKKMAKLETIVGNITRNYGHLSRKINFVQGLRSREDYLYKHSLNVAALCAMMGHVLNIRGEEQHATVTAAVIHDIGHLKLPEELLGRTGLTPEEQAVKDRIQMEGFQLLDDVLSADMGIKRICTQFYRCLREFEDGKMPDMRIVHGAKILLVAQVYDQMTAMQFGRDPASEVAAIRHLLDHPELFDPKVVRALIDSIYILAPGTSVELNTGEKALVITSNEENILQPIILCFKDNSIMDLSNREYADVSIKDIMKTMDNRYIMDTAALKRQGIQVEEPDYVAVPEAE